MSFAIRNLSVMHFANGFTMWHYKAGDDTQSVCRAKGYFADASDMFADGDMICISTAKDGGCILYVTTAENDNLETESLR